MAEVKREIRDFGEYIAGAKKELWATGMIDPADIEEMNESERRKYLIKKVIFPKPDIKGKISDGSLSRESAYYLDKVWAAIPETIPIEAYDDRERLKNYTENVTWLRDYLAEKSKLSRETIYPAFQDKFLIPLYGHIVEIKPEAKDTVTRKLLKAVQLTGYDLHKKGRFFGMTPEEKQDAEFEETYVIGQLGDTYKLHEDKYAKLDSRYRWSIEKSEGSYSHYFYYSASDNNAPTITEHSGENGTFFILNTKNNTLLAQDFVSEESAEEWLGKFKIFSLGYAELTKKEKPEKKRKVSFKLKSAEHITRTGLPDYRNGQDVTGQMLIDEFGFRGGQFGNYLDDEDRQNNLNGFYEACKDEAVILGITDKSLSFGKKLAVAFGARGRGKAMAHFEPLENVINLTKYKGAGTFGHEDGHALDYYLARIFNAREMFLSDDYLSSVEGLKETLPAFGKIIKRMKRIENGEFTEFYKGSCEFDKTYAKSGHGYWSSNTEMFARSFDCYLQRKLEKMNAHSGYLTSYAKSFKTELSDGTVIKAYPDGKDMDDLEVLFDELFEEMKQAGILERRRK